jgi:DNA polymerase elongation subunit (family B)
MVMKRENIADKALWTAKKRYIMNVYDAEGVRYETPQLKVMGIESVRSSTPAACKEKMKGIFNIIMNGTEEDAINYIDKFREEFRTLKSFIDPMSTVMSAIGWQTEHISDLSEFFG